MADLGIPFDGKVSKQDVPALARRVAKRQGGARFSTLMIALGLLLLVLSAVQARAGNSDGALQWFGLGFSFVAVGLGVRWSERRAYRRLAASAVHRGAVLESGVSIQGPDSKTLLRWSSFATLERQGRLLILWLKDGRALPLASALFSDEEAFAAARDLIEAGMAGGGPPG
jgi:hypothetical protein